MEGNRGKMTENPTISINIVKNTTPKVALFCLSLNDLASLIKLALPRGSTG
jgi:hypothetical protein